MVPSAAPLFWLRIGSVANTAGGSRQRSAGCPARASWTARHTRSGVHGRSTCRTPSGRSASTTAFCTAGVDPTVADSPMPFAPSGFSGVGVSVLAVSNVEQVGRARHPVVGERGGERLAVGVEDDLLVQRLRDALGEPAVLLALDEQRVEDAPAVVDGDVPPRRDLAGLGVDLDHRHVRAERERGAVLVEVEPGVQRLAVGSAALGDLRPR